MASELPAGWLPLLSPDGRTYFFNEATKETTWTKPGVSGSGAAAPVPAPAASEKAKTASAGPATVDQRYTLATLVSTTGQKDHGQGHFELEKPELLEINIGTHAPFAYIKTGSMIARRGNIRFTRQGSMSMPLAIILLHPCYVFRTYCHGPSLMF